MRPPAPDTESHVTPLLPRRRATLSLAVAVLVLAAFATACSPCPVGADPRERPGSSHSAQRPGTPGPDAAAAEDDSSTLDLMANSHTEPSSLWVVVNKPTPLDPIDYEPELATVRGYLVQPVVVDDLTALLAAADDDDVHLTLRSAYRSYDAQVRVYDDWARQLGRDRADQVSAHPGHSEHQTGLAVDLGSSSRPECDFEACFADTAEGRWVAAHAGDFGFLMRYTQQNATITGFAPEGWHLRYVGRELAAYLRGHAITTLEEAFGVPGGPDYP